MLEVLVAAVILISLILYGIMGGADFGGGMWDLLATGPRRHRQREAISDAIAPIWEANHVCSFWSLSCYLPAFPGRFR